MSFVAVAASASRSGVDVAHWSAASGAADRTELDAAIKRADYLVLGEIHDNPWHHRLQAEWLALFADHHAGAISVGVEQLTVDQRPQLEAFLGQTSDDAASFAEAVGWADSGWPDYAIYQPLFAAALERQLPIVPLMFSNQLTRDVMREGPGAVLPAKSLARLQPETLLDAEDRIAVEEAMQAAHCGKLPAHLLPAMVDVQIARDAFMAQAIADAGAPAVIITGNGHARRDRGIPRFLQRLQPDARVVVVMLLEESPDLPLAEQARQQAAPALTDYAAFTPAPARDDPCLAFQ